MPSYQRAVPVLLVADVEASLRWYADVLGFAADTFPPDPPYSLAILRQMLPRSCCSPRAMREPTPRLPASPIRSFGGRFI